MSDIAFVEVVDSNEGYAQEIRAREHLIWADEPVELEGLDSGPTPMELLLAALGSCTTITVRMYARRKGWPLEELRIRLRHQKAENAGEQGGEAITDLIEKEIEMTGSLTAEQRTRLLEIADRCPVHRTLMGNIQIRSVDMLAGEVE